MFSPPTQTRRITQLPMSPPPRYESNLGGKASTLRRTTTGTNILQGSPSVFSPPSRQSRGERSRDELMRVQSFGAASRSDSVDLAAPESDTLNPSRVNIDCLLLSV